MRRLLLIAGLVSVGCREPTEVTLTLHTDVGCPNVHDTIIAIGPTSSYMTDPPSVAHTGCNSAEGRIGSLVVVPSGVDAPVGVQVVTALGATPARSCDPNNPSGDCIVARRVFRFVSHTALELPMEMSGSCRGKACPLDQTCFEGACVTATIPDLRACSSPDGCPDGGVVDAGSPDSGPPDAGQDAGDPLLAGLVLYYDFDTSTNPVPDQSGNGNTGSVSAATFSNAGHKGGSLTLTSVSSLVAVNPSPSLAAINQKDGATISAWIRVEPNQTFPYNGGWIFDHDPFGLDDLELWIQPMTLDMCGDGNPGHPYNVCTSSGITSSVWTHVALVATSSSVKVYIDGVAKGTNASVTTAFGITKQSFFGYGWVGALDEVRLYARPLDDAEIAALAKL